MYASQNTMVLKFVAIFKKYFILKINCMPNDMCYHPIKFEKQKNYHCSTFGVK